MLEQAILIFHVIGAILIVGLILLQQGKGADAGASFGGGASQTVLGVQGGGNILTRWTSILAALFFTSSLTLGYFAKQKTGFTDELIIDVPALESQAPVNDEVPSLSVDQADVAEQEVPALDVPVEEASEQ